MHFLVHNFTNLLNTCITFPNYQFTSALLDKSNKNIFKKMKEHVGISKPKKHTNKIGMVPLTPKLK